MAKRFDFHSHILPGIDDGSKSVEESITMLRMEAEQGIDCVVATPHFYADYDSPQRFLDRRARALERLQEAREQNPGLPEIKIGAEVYFYSGISDSDAIAELTIAKKRCILIEMPFGKWTDSMYRELEGIYTKQGLTPVIAHVDRYIGPFRTFGIPERLAELPVIVQANAEFFLRRSTSAMALRMLRDGKIHLLGSDAHNLRDRKPNLGEALDLIEKRLGTAPLEQMHALAGDVLYGFRTVAQ